MAVTREDLILSHIPMVRRMAGKMAKGLPRFVDDEDLVSSGMVGLVQAADAFQPHLGYAFSTFASRRVFGAMLDDLRGMDWVKRRDGKGRRRSPDVDKAALVKFEPVKEGLIAEAKSDRLEERDRIDHLLREFSRTEKIIIKTCLIDGEPQRVASDAVGYTASRVSQWMPGIKARLRTKLTRIG